MLLLCTVELKLPLEYKTFIVYIYLSHNDLLNVTYFMVMVDCNQHAFKFVWQFDNILLRHLFSVLLTSVIS